MLIETVEFLLNIAGSLAGVRTRNTGHSGTLNARSPEPPLITAKRPALGSNKQYSRCPHGRFLKHRVHWVSKIKSIDNFSRWVSNGLATCVELVLAAVGYGRGRPAAGGRSAPAHPLATTRHGSYLGKSYRTIVSSAQFVLVAVVANSLVRRDIHFFLINLAMLYVQKNDLVMPVHMIDINCIVTVINLLFIYNSYPIKE